MLVTLSLIVVSRLFWEPYVISSGSMKPNLLVSDYIAVVPARAPFRRGDILVFDHQIKNETYIARLIGLPGERIEMRDAAVYINGTALPQAPNGTFVEVLERQGGLGLLPQCAGGPVGLGAACEKSIVVETLPNGVSYNTLDIRLSPLDVAGPYDVPDDHYFFLGDNRDNSNDSRVPMVSGGMGFVPETSIHGRVVRVVLPQWGERPWWLTVLTDERFMERVN